MPAMARRFSTSSFLETYGAVLGLSLLIGLGCLISPDAFAKPLNFINILRQSSFIGVIAVGMTFVIILGGIDLSVGSMVALLGGLGIMAMNAVATSPDPVEGVQYAPILLAAAIMLVGGPLLGLLNGVLIGKGRLTPFIATLGAMAAYRSLALAFADGGEYRSQVSSFRLIGGGKIDVPFIHVVDAPLPIHYPVLAFIVVAALAHLLLRKCAFGLQVQAIGDNERAATYGAVRVARVRMLTYALSGLTCGIAALLISSRLNSVSSSQTGTLYELDAIAAVVVGGTRMQGGSGRIWGTVVGVLILGVVNNLLNMLNPDVLGQISRTLHIGWTHLDRLNVIHLQGFIKGAIIILAVLLQRSRRA
jgi:ribose transport system permease protein